MKIVFTYKDGFKQEVEVKRHLTRALAEAYRIKYYSPFHDRGVVYNGKERIGLDDYIQGLIGTEKCLVK